MTKVLGVRRVRSTHIQSSHGGVRAGAGAPEGNESAKKRLPWLDNYDLDTFAGVDAFTKELLKKTFTGELGTRQSADCLAILHLLLERRFWLPSGCDKWSPETHKFNDPWPGQGEEDTPSPRELSPEAEAAIAAIRKTAEELSEE
jgi:hypothetical protein